MTTEQSRSMKLLTKENRRIIGRMQRNLETYNLNELEYERTISDIIGMALEYQERGESFSSAIGMDCASFCRELIRNLPLQSRGERALEFCRWTLWCVGLYVPVVWLLSFFISYMPSASASVYLYATIAFLIKYLVVTLVLVFGLFYVKRNVYHSRSMVWSLYFVVLLLTYFAVDFTPLDEIPEVETKINIVIWALSFGAAITGVSLTKRAIARKYARKQNPGTKGTY